MFRSIVNIACAAILPLTATVVVACLLWTTLPPEPVDPNRWPLLPGEVRGRTVEGVILDNGLNPLDAIDYR